MNGSNRQSRRLLARKHDLNVAAVDRRAGLAIVNGELFQLFCPDDEVVQLYGEQFFPIDEDAILPGEWIRDIDEADDPEDPRDNPDLPGWGTVVQWSDLHHFTYQFAGED